MKIDPKRDDYSRSSETRLHYVGCCCCCCCCTFWVGGLIGAAVSAASSNSERPAENTKTIPDNIRRRSRAWFLISFVVLTGLTAAGFFALAGASSQARVIITTFIWFLVLFAPVMQFLFAKLIADKAIRRHTNDPAVLELLRQRHSKIVIGSLGGYMLGWVVLFLIGLISTLSP